MQQLLEIMQKLRAECPWDKAQTPQTLTKYAIEEAYEVEDAIRSGDIQHIKEELGDLLLQVVFQSQMFSEQGAFDFHDVVDSLREKLIRRHPHVFEDNFDTLDEQQVNELWQRIKQQEKRASGKESQSRLDKVKLGASLIQAQKIQEYAATLNFDWESVDGAWQKLDEELGELKSAVLSNNQKYVEEELGDSLFAMINVGRKLDQDCDQALFTTIHKFRSRFSYIEQQLELQNLTPQQCDLQQLDELWSEAKNNEKK